MSSIDERIVAMKFDNGEFQGEAQKTINTMAELKRTFQMDGIAQGVENISSKFNVFGAIGFTALQTLTNAAINFGQQIASSIMDPLIEGGKKRALNIEQAKFQFKGLGMDVEASMADALYAVQNTAFGLDEAAVAASQFGASGVKSGTEMQNALRGISGVAAMAGTSYSDIADVFTKVAGQGRLMGDDLNRLGTRGINAAATLAASMGTTEEAVREMVTKGQIDFNTFSSAMSAAFGEHATKANETYTGSLSNMRAAIARIGASFATVDFESQRQQFNAMTPAIDNVAKAIKPVLDLYTELKNTSTENFVAAFAALNEVEPDKLAADVNALPPAFQGLNNILTSLYRIVKPIKDAFGEVFPPALPDIIRTLASGFRDLTEKLLVSEEASAGIKTFFVSFFTVLKMAGAIIGGVFSVVGNLVRVVWELAGGILGLIAPIGNLILSFIPVGDGINDSTSAIQGFFGWINTLINIITGPLIDGLRKGGDGFESFLDPGSIKSKIMTIINWIRDLIGAVGAMSDALFKGDTSGGGFFGSDNAFLNGLGKIRSVIIDLASRSAEFFTGGAKGVKSFFGAIGDGISDAFQNVDIDWNLILATVNTGLLAVLGVGIGKTIKTLITNLTDFSSIKDSFAGVLDSVAGALDRFNNEAEESWADKMIKIGVALLILAGAVAVMSMVDPERMVGSLVSLGVAMGVLVGAMFVIDKLDIAPAIKASIAITILAGALFILSLAVVKMGELDWDELAKGLIGLSVSVIALVYAAQVIEKDADKMIKAAVALGFMAGAVLLLASAVAVFGMMPMDMLVQGAISATVALTLLVTMAAALQKFAPKMVLSAVGLMAMAAALNMLIIPITAFGLLPVEVLVQGIIVMTLLLGILTLIANQLAPKAPQFALAAVGLMAMAVALNLLVIPIMILGALNFETLLQGLVGLGIALTLLVLAANMATGAIQGAGAMILMALAVTMLAIALAILAAIPIEGLAIGLIVLIGLFALLIISAALVTPVIPGLLALTGAIALLGLGLILMAAAVVVFAIGIGMLGPALISVTGGLVAFSESAGTILSGVPAMLAMGAALIVFGAGALIAGAGVLVLGVGLLILGVGLTMVAVSGLAGVTALTAVINAMMKLMEHVPGMLILGATFLTLGAGTLVLGAALLLLAAGVGLVALSLMMLIPMGTLASVSLEMFMKAMEKASKKTSGIDKLVVSLVPLGPALAAIGLAAAGGAAGVAGLALGFAALSMAAVAAGSSIVGMAAMVGSSVPRAIVMTTLAAQAFQVMVVTMLASLGLLRAGVQSTLPSVLAAASVLAAGLTARVVAGIVGGYGAMSSAGYGVGSAITQGMARGIQNGSGSVTAAARAVAARALAASKAELGIRSPSRAYYEVGDFSNQGLAGGMLGTIGKVVKASEAVAGAAIDTVRNTLSGLKSAIASDIDINPTIRPELDLSGFRSAAGQMNGIFSSASPTLTLDNSRAMAVSTASALEEDDIERAMSVRGSGATVNYTQNNYSPKALSEGEIYRTSRSLIPRIKEELEKQ